MELLPAGQYKFNQKDDKNPKKPMIFVKLTESALRALNDYLKQPKMYGETPKIEFTEDSKGLIEIPASSRGISGTGTCMARFKFNLESNVAMEGRQGRFECIKYRQGSKKIKRCGLLTQRLKIHANEDVFETTKNRMAEVDLEQRKICTKEIDLKLETVNRQTKVDRSSKSKPSLLTAIPEIGLNKIGSPRLTRARNKNSTVLTKLNSPIAKRPLKARIIHMLAVRPLKKMEISAALRRDGLRDSDKNLLNATLMSVATMKDNVYHLLRHMWNDVQPDWPFYSDEERERMQRNKEQNVLTVINAVTSTSTLSPKNLSLGDMSPSRPGYIKGVDGLSTKRKRISHFSRPNFTPKRLSVVENGSVNQISPCRVTTGYDDILEKCGLPNPASKTSPVRFKHVKTDKRVFGNAHVNRDNFFGWDERNQSDNNAQSLVIQNEHHDSGIISEHHDSERIEKMCTSPAFSLADGPDFTEIYVTITNPEQRRRYKNEFELYYNEYMSVHGEVMPVTSEFVNLRMRYRECEKGSPEYLETEKQIVQKYESLMKADYNSKKERHEYLHRLLSHIKKLVNDYDKNMYEKN